MVSSSVRLRCSSFSVSSSKRFGMFLRTGVIKGSRGSCEPFQQRLGEVALITDQLAYQPRHHLRQRLAIIDVASGELPGQ